MNRIVVQKTPDIQAFLIGDDEKIIASAHGVRDLEAIGRLVAQNPSLFGLEAVFAKNREIDELDD